MTKPSLAGAARALLPLAALGALAGSAHAHCRLDAPNGGEVLRVGSTFTIRWTELIAHNVRNWDLYYSTTGSSGPWLPIALDLAPSSRSFVWHVPDAPSGLVRVRVVQDMLSQTYDDVSDRDLTIAPSLSASAATISLTSGGAQDLRIDAGSSLAGASYLVLGSASGASPGLTLGGFPLPLNPDGYLFQTLAAPGVAPLAASLGTLDGSGRATARFSLPPGLPAALQGLRLHHAAIVFHPAGPTIVLASNAVALTLDG